MCIWLVERFAERFLAVYNVPGNHHGYGGTDWDAYEAPTPEAKYHFGATMHHGLLARATLWADFQRGKPQVEEACRVGMNDFRRIKGITPAGIKTRHGEHLAFLEAHIEPDGIAMTHFAPFWQSILPSYGSSELNGFYAWDLEDMCCTSALPYGCMGISIPEVITGSNIRSLSAIRPGTRAWTTIRSLSSSCRDQRRTVANCATLPTT